MLPLENVADAINGNSQVFLDSADGVRLDAVTQSLGIKRPHMGWSDTKLRAVVKAIALRDKVDEDVFRRVLEICFGPQFTRASNMPSASIIDAQTVTVNTPSQFVQCGTMVFDPGQTTEETVPFVYRDLTTSTVYLTRPLRFPHRAIPDGEGRLAATAAAGAVSLVLKNSTPLPASQYPYPLLLDGGTEIEEIVLVQNNNTVTNTLTLVAGTLYEHKGPSAQFWQKPLAVAAQARHVFVQLGAGATRTAPATGWLRINAGGATEEVREYDGNDATLGHLSLAEPLAFGHSIGEPVEIVRPGAPVCTASVIQQGVHWDLYQTEQRHLTVYVPSTFRPYTIFDVSYLHHMTPPAFATTVAAPGVGPLDTVVPLTSVAGLPDEAGMLDIGGALYWYDLKTDGAVPSVTLPREIGAGYVAGTAVSLVTTPYAGTRLDDGNWLDYTSVPPAPRTLLGSPGYFPGPYLDNPADYLPSSISTTTTAEIPAAAYVETAQSAGRLCLEVDTLAGWPAAIVEVQVGRGTGSSEVATASDLTLRTSAATTTTGALAGDIVLPCVATVAFPEGDGTNPAGYRIIIDEGGVNEEVVEVRQNDTGANTLSLGTALVNPHALGETVTLLADVLTFELPLDYAHAAGARAEVRWSELPVLDGSSLPTANGTIILNFGWERHPIYRRIRNYPGGATFYMRPGWFQETSIPLGGGVLAGVTTFTVERAWPFPCGGDGVHPLGYRLVLDSGGANEEVVEVLTADGETGTFVLTAPTANPHPDFDTVRLCPYDFPTTNYPYRIWMAPGLGNEEAVSVTAYDPVEDAITLSGAPALSHSSRDWVEYRHAGPVVLEYASRTGNVLTLAEPTIIEGPYGVGTRVTLSRGPAERPVSPGGFPFTLPPNPAACFAEIVDLIRAAGVQVDVVRER